MNKNFVAAALLASCAALPVSAVTLTSDFTMGVEATIEQNFKLVTHSDNSSSATVTLGKWDPSTGHEPIDLRMAIVGSSGKNITLSANGLVLTSQVDRSSTLGVGLEVLRADGATSIGYLDEGNVTLPSAQSSEFVFRVNTFASASVAPGDFKGTVVVTAAQAL